MTVRPRPGLRHPHVLACPCGREQALADTRDRGGVTIEEAKSIGWRVADGVPPTGRTVRGTCPFCARPS